jgi:hypothetical protein
VQPPSAQHIEKQGWTYVSKPSQLARKAHEPQTEITGLAFTLVRACERAPASAAPRRA